MAGIGDVGRLSEWIYVRYVGEAEVKKDPYAGWARDPENRIIKLKPEKAYAWKWRKAIIKVVPNLLNPVYFGLEISRNWLKRTH
jgi:hypothetical protein